ncbi:MAG: DEAD/DEAH box helicase family protein, partial [Rhodobacteraceae bacterium]|nr:DEAD/DEAH box helicase family protein [Paracoccaceae bacterium]
MTTENKWSHYFPYDEIRPQQSEAIESALEAFKAGKKFVIIEAATGIGKSAVGYTINKTMLSPAGADYRSKGDYLHGGYFLTTQKILQEQYISDFSSIASLKSSSDYTCKIHKKQTCG